jgi:endogenous inhibitor of DNA gyrase (YacG/DUF329 family)
MSATIAAFMYCPNCGQQQVSGEMRFCSRCGLALTGLAEWLAGGSLPVQRADEIPVSEPSRRRKHIRRASKLMFFSGVLLPVFVLLCAAIEEGAPLLLPGGIFFISLVWLLYARLFMDDTAPAQQPAFGTIPARSSLPPAVNTPNIGRQQVRTNELAQPRSVTEHTTRLLDNE